MALQPNGWNFRSVRRTGLACTLALSWWLSSSLLAQATNPSVVLITIDTLRADRVGAYGYDKAETPTMDALASEGVLFEKAVVQTPITLPSHASILTATYPPFHGVQDVVGRLREGVPIVSEWFRDRGYATGAFVGASVLSKDWGLDRGFEHYDDEFPAASPQGKVEFDRVERSAEEVISRALAWLEGRRQRPFFLWVHVYDPHDPYLAPAPFGERFQDRPYDGEIAYVDAQLRVLFERLKQWGLYDSSLITVTSDHGEMLGEHGEEHHGFFVYEAALRVPLIIKAPEGKVGPREVKGVRVPNQVRSVDIVPTIAQLLGEPIPQWSQGEGLLAFMLGRREGVDLPAYAETHYPRIHFGWSPLFSLSDGRRKAIQAPTPELFDLAEDPGELRNLASRNQALFNRLHEHIREIQSKYASPQDADQSSSVEVDAETRQKLQSLGYVSFSSGATTPSEWAGLPDPKEKIGIYNRLNQAIRHSREGRIPQAIEALSEVAKLEPEMPIVHFMLGAEYARLRRHLQAIEQFKLAIRHNPESDVARLNLAMSYSAAGLSSKAMETARELVERNPDNHAAGQLLARQLAKAGRLEEAVAALRAVALRRPDLADAHNNLGAYLFSLGRLEEAAESYKNALRQTPGQVEALINLSLTYVRLGRFEEALTQSQRAVQAAPGAALAHYYLGQSLLGTGAKEKARQAFERANQLNPSLKIPSF